MRIIQGGARQHDARALLLVRDAPADPVIKVHRIADGRTAACSVTEVPEAGSALRVALQRRGVRAFRLEASGLSAGTPHRIMASAGGIGAGADFSTLPRALPAEGLTVAVASCYYDGYRRDRALQAALARKRWGQAPAFHIWAGDNLYVDVPADTHDHRPVDHTLDRYLRYYLDGGYGLVRGMAPAFTTSDDHEFWNNYPEAVPWLSRSWSGNWRGYRQATLDCLSLFQSGQNPGGAGRAWFDFAIAPLRFFFLEVRAFRNRKGHGPRTMVPEAALKELARWALDLKGPGVLVLGQPLWIAEGDVRDYNPPAYPEQYRRIWQALRHAPYDMLVISGDVHHSRVAKISFGGSANRHVYEFVTSPVCHIPTLGATIGLGDAQDRGSLDEVPGKVPSSGQSLSARYFFGADAQHSFGILRFVPQANNEVRVGVRFMDYHPKDQNAQAKPVRRLPRMPGARHRFCHDSKLFTLRMR